jgi:hypothetical protein
VSNPLSLPRRPKQNFEQLANLLLLDDGMPQGKLGLDLVAVSAPMSLAQHVALLDQLGEDLVGAALRDADGSGDVAQADAGVMGMQSRTWALLVRKSQRLATASNGIPL